MPLEFQVYDANSQQLATSAKEIAESSPYRIGPKPKTLPSLPARIPVDQLRFMALTLNNPDIALCYPPVQGSGSLDGNAPATVYKEIDASDFDALDPQLSASPVADSFNTSYPTMEAVKAFIWSQPSKDAMRSEIKRLELPVCDADATKEDLATHFIDGISAKRGASPLSLPSASSALSKQQLTVATETVQLQGLLCEIRNVVTGSSALPMGAFTMASHLSPLMVRTLLTMVKCQVDIYKRVVGRIAAGSSVVGNERFSRSITITFRDVLSGYKTSAVELVIGFLPIGTIAFLSLLRTIGQPVQTSVPQLLEDLRKLQLHIGSADYSLSPLYTALKSGAVQLRKLGLDTWTPDQLGQALFGAEGAPLVDWIQHRSSMSTQLSSALSVVHVKTVQNQPVLESDIDAVMAALATETRLQDLVALRAQHSSRGRNHDPLLAGVLPPSPSDSPTTEPCLAFLTDRGCWRNKKCPFVHYHPGNQISRSAQNAMYPSLAKRGLRRPQGLNVDKVKDAGFDVTELEACFSPGTYTAKGDASSANREKASGKGRKKESQKESLVAAIREIMAGPASANASGATPVAAEAVPTTFALLPAEQRNRPATSAEVAVAVSTISSQVSDQQRSDFGALTDKEFRDHFANLFSL